VRYAQMRGWQKIRPRCSCQNRCGLVRSRLNSAKIRQLPNSMNSRPSSQNLSGSSRPLARHLVCGAALGMTAVMITSPAQAAFHLWNIREIYSDASGSLQFIEFFTSSGSQQFTGGQQVRVSSGALNMTFTLPSNLPGDTANHAFLMGTAGLQAAGGPTPDYIMPNNFLFTGGGTITFFGVNGGPYTALPTDGSLSRTWNGGNAPNTPQNFAGQIGMVAVPEPGILALLGLGGLGLCCFLRRRPVAR